MIEEMIVDSGNAGLFFFGVVLIAAGIMGLLGRYVGKSKGRPGAGTALGLLFGPLGVIVIALLPRTPEAEAEFVLARDASIRRMS